MKATHRALRDGTAAEHERLDELFGRFSLNDQASYADFLLAHAEALLPVEAWLDGAGAARIVADWPQRRRGALLLADLAALGVTAPVVAPAAFPADDASIAGAIYVVEGSRLGGKLLTKQLASGFARQYLDPNQDVSWRSLLATIDALLRSDDDIDRAIATARAVFTRFEAAGRRRLAKG